VSGRYGSSWTEQTINEKERVRLIVSTSVNDENCLEHFLPYWKRMKFLYFMCMHVRRPPDAHPYFIPLNLFSLSLIVSLEFLDYFFLSNETNFPKMYPVLVTAVLAKKKKEKFFSLSRSLLECLVPLDFSSVSCKSIILLSIALKEKLLSSVSPISILCSDGENKIIPQPFSFSHQNAVWIS